MIQLVRYWRIDIDRSRYWKMVRGNNISDYIGLTIPEMIFGCTILAMLIIGLIVLLRNK